MQAQAETLSPFVREFRRFFRQFARWVGRNFTDMTISGLEHLDQPRPVIFTANHASTYDAVLFIAYMPENTQLVGPGDFKLLFPANVLINLGGIVQIKRAALDRDSLRLMSGALEAGMHLALFPEGGTWEKRLDDVKPGAAYLSSLHKAPLVPISFGGTYQVWSRILRLQRPRITVHIGEPMPPVEITDRKRRAEILSESSLALMQRIYEHLPREDQARYDLAAHQQFRALIASSPGVLAEPVPDFPVLAEIFSKPNLVSPFWRNARLPLRPLVRHSDYYPAAQFVIAAERMTHALNGPYAGYFQYRLGDKKAARVAEELEALRRLALAAHERRQKLRFTPLVELADSPLPPNT